MREVRWRRRLVGLAVAAVVGDRRGSGNARRRDERIGAHCVGNHPDAWRLGLEGRWRLQLAVKRVNASATVKIDVAAAALDKDYVHYALDCAGITFAPSGRAL